MDSAVFGYIRVSQAEGEGGLATRRRILNDYGLRDDRIFSDIGSGRSMARPEWKRLRGMLQPGDVVVVPRLDRLARNLSEGLRAVEELHRQQVRIRSLADGLDTGDDSPVSRLMLHLLLSLAEWERDTIGERVKAGVERAASEGRKGGRRPVLSGQRLRDAEAFLARTGNVSETAREYGVSRNVARAVKNGEYPGQNGSRPGGIDNAEPES